jgi:TetR/AcrR family transcriptional regulator, regulator of cefoperazone and chloramphenicol sensitivity
MSNNCLKYSCEQLLEGKMKPVKGAATHAATRQALLEAAGGVFAEHGYRDTTVRRICQRAGANVAAVNYHFGDKLNLYLEVVRRAHAASLGKYPPDLGVKAAASPEERLRAFVRSFLFRIFDTGPTAWLGKLMAMEMVNPSGALKTLVEERFRPMVGLLYGIVSEILGPSARPEAIRLCGFSIMSQCVFHAHCRPVVEELYPEERFQPADVERLADHIIRFSLAGLREAAAGSCGRAARATTCPTVHRRH